MPCNPPFLAAEWQKHHSSSIVLMNPNAATLPLLRSPLASCLARWLCGIGRMINNHLQQHLHRRGSVSFSITFPAPSGVALRQNDSECFDSHPILHTWRCDMGLTQNCIAAWHLVRSSVNLHSPRCTGRARTCFEQDCFTRGKALFFEAEKWTRPPTLRVTVVEHAKFSPLSWLDVRDSSYE